MLITTKGQVTIPQHIRDSFGFLPHTEVEFVIEDDKVMLRKAESGSRMVKKVLNQIRGRYAIRFTTEELMKMTRE